jgi:hypothetical protein
MFQKRRRSGECRGALSVIYLLFARHDTFIEVLHPSPPHIPLYLVLIPCSTMLCPRESQATRLCIEHRKITICSCMSGPLVPYLIMRAVHSCVVSSSGHS